MNTSKQSQPIQLDIEGMSCNSCAARIENTLRADPRIVSATVNFAAKTASVQTNAQASDVAALIASLGYKASLSGQLAQLEEREKKELGHAKNQVILALSLALPVFLLAMVLPPFDWSAYLQAALTLVLMSGPGRGFYVRAWLQAMHRAIGMDALVSMGTGVAFGYSIYLQASGHEHLYYESVAVIIAFVLLGKFLEERARQQISMALRQLAKLRPESTHLWHLNSDGKEVITDVAASTLKPGDKVMVRVGERIPVDGICERGESSVDSAMMTGESIPERVTVGSKVIAGTVNLNGPLVISATGVGNDTEIARIVAAVEAAQMSKAPIQRLADQVASWFVPAAIVIAALTWIIWAIMSGDFFAGLSPAVAVLVVACPCALGLATPISIMAATGLAARHGILIRDAVSLQTLHRVDTVVFDKTGTLTTGQMEVESCKVVSSKVTNKDAISAARALELGSLHPIAQAIVRFADHEDSIDPSIKVSAITEKPGVGVTGEVIGFGTLTIGSFDHPPDGTTAVALTNGETTLAIFNLKDHLRPEAAAAVQKLKKLGITSVIASGDREDIVAAVAKDVGDIPYHSNLKPVDKSKLIEKLKAEHHVVAMAGDGINDAPSLAVADVGLAMGSGAEAAIAVAGITIRDSSISGLVDAIQLSRATFRNIKENLFWAFAYNTILIPAAALGRLSPMLAGTAMGLSSLFVVGNALRLKLTTTTK